MTDVFQGHSAREHTPSHTFSSSRHTCTQICHYETYTLDECHEVPKEFWQNTRTFAPDGDDFYCWPRVGRCADICTSPTGCTFGGAFYFDNPNKYDLAKISWEKSLVSFDCHKNKTEATA
ncbi:hypothetical protein NUW58_g8152 [Xylaria curta]|uniref:Uncharacterized protein n=1 Tax=Xylaria curta TaxID=42375 RepID=A0ACC1NAU6_9PEZI|nr:hypothetical protein NUW58_g8152 [Xylaria curta]